MRKNYHILIAKEKLNNYLSSEMWLKINES